MERENVFYIKNMVCNRCILVVTRLLEKAGFTPLDVGLGTVRERCHRDYSALSKLFSEVNGISIEKYFLAQRIERVKELLAYGDLTVSEIADKLRYSSVAHLSAQFRAQTGMSPTEFRRLKGRGLKPLDEV